MDIFRLIDPGTDKIQVIKLVKTYTKLGLKESKDLVDQVPSDFVIDQEYTDPEKLIEEFKKCGAKVILVNAQKHPTNESQDQEKKYFMLSLGGPDKILLIKLIREYTDLGLKESKDLIENIPSVFEVDTRTNCSDVKKKFLDIGALIEEVTQDDMKKFKEKNDEPHPLQLKIELSDSGRYILEVAKLIQFFSSLSIDEAKYLAENTPSIFVVEKSEYSFEQIKKNFEGIGALVKKIIDIQISQKIDSEDVQASQTLKKPRAVGELEQQNEQDSTHSIVFKSEIQSTNIDNMLLEQKDQKAQKTDIINALIFTNLAAIGLSVVPIGFWGIIFIVSMIIAFLLRKKNPSSNKLGIIAFSLVINYFIAKKFYIIYLWPFITGTHRLADFYNFFKVLFFPTNITVLIAAALAYFMASNRTLFKSI
jgi:ribosomal protein L7/L12